MAHPSPHAHPLHFVEYGEGTPVLALHGWGPDHRLMTGCLEPVFANRPGFRRIYPDLPGMGRTPAPEWITSSDDLLATVEGFIDSQIGGTPFLLVGESYGGYLARAIAHRRKDQVLGLALICPVGTVLERDRRTVPPRTTVVHDPETVASMDPRDAEEFVGIAVVQSAETARRFVDEILSGVRLADEAALSRIQQRWELSAPPEDGTPYPRPTLILTGRQDDRTGYADVYPLLDHYPRATFAVLDAAGHNLQIEQPELCEALFSEWLQRVARSAPGHLEWLRSLR